MNFTNNNLKKAVDWKIFELQSLLISNNVEVDDLNESILWFQPRHIAEVIEERSTEGRCGYPLCDSRLSTKKGQCRIDYQEKKIYGVDVSYSYCSTICIENAKKLEQKLDNSLPYSRGIVRSLDLNVPMKSSIDDVLSLLGPQAKVQKLANTGGTGILIPPPQFSSGFPMTDTGEIPVVFNDGIATTNLSSLSNNNEGGYIKDLDLKNEQHVVNAINISTMSISPSFHSSLRYHDSDDGNNELADISNVPSTQCINPTDKTKHYSILREEVMVGSSFAPSNDDSSSSNQTVSTDSHSIDRDADNQKDNNKKEDQSSSSGSNNKRRLNKILPVEKSSVVAAKELPIDEIFATMNALTKKHNLRKENESSKSSNDDDNNLVKSGGANNIENRFINGSILQMHEENLSYKIANKYRSSSNVSEVLSTHIDQDSSPSTTTASAYVVQPVPAGASLIYKTNRKHSGCKSVSWIESSANKSNNVAMSGNKLVNSSSDQSTFSSSDAAAVCNNSNANDTSDSGRFCNTSAAISSSSTTTNSIPSSSVVMRGMAMQFNGAIMERVDAKPLSEAAMMLKQEPMLAVSTRSNFNLNQFAACNDKLSTVVSGYRISQQHQKSLPNIKPSARQQQQQQQQLFVGSNLNVWNGFEEEEKQRATNKMVISDINCNEIQKDNGGFNENYYDNNNPAAALAMAIEGYTTSGVTSADNNNSMAAIKQYIYVSPATTLQNLSYYPFAVSADGSVPIPNLGDDYRSPITISNEQKNCSDVVMEECFSESDYSSRQSDDDDDDNNNSEKNSSSNCSIFLKVWSTLDDLFFNPTSIFSEHDGNGVEISESSNSLVVTTHVSTDIDSNEEDNNNQQRPGMALETIQSQEATMKLLLRGITSAERLLNLFQQYLINMKDRNIYHEIKNKLLASTATLLHKTYLRNYQSLDDYEEKIAKDSNTIIGAGLQSAGWTLIGILIIDAIVNKKKIGPLCIDESDGIKNPSIKMISLTPTGKIGGAYNGAASLATSGCCSLDSRYVAVPALETRSISDAVAWNNKVEQLAGSVLGGSAMTHLRVDDLRILRSFFDQL